MTTRVGPGETVLIFSSRGGREEELRLSEWCVFCPHWHILRPPKIFPDFFFSTREISRTDITIRLIVAVFVPKAGVRLILSNVKMNTSFSADIRQL